MLPPAVLNTLGTVFFYMNQSQPVNIQVLLTAGLMFPAFLEILFAPLSDVS